MYNRLGFDAGGAAQQIGTGVASYAIKTGTTMAITSLTSGAAAGSMGAMIGAAAGPIGAIIGFAVSMLASLFGPDPKKPVFGLTIVVPEGATPKVGTVLDLLRKPMFLWQDNAENLSTQLNVPPPGAMVITSGGLKEAHEAVKKMDFNAISSRVAAVAAPYAEVLSKVTDPQIKAALLAYNLPFERVSNYYFNLDKQKNPKARALQPHWDQYKVTGGEKFSKAFEKGLKAIAAKLNEAFVSYVGVDVAGGGRIVNGELATKAFKPTAASTLAGLTDSPYGWLILLGGGYLLLKG